MNSFKLALPVMALTGLVLAGCPSDDIGTTATDSTGEDSTTTSGTNPTATMTMTMTMTQTATVADTTMGMDSTTADPTGGSTSTGEDPFVFDETPYEDYVQVDRMGFAAVNSGLNLLGDKDAYNLGTPVDDALEVFEDNINDSLNTLHLGAPMMQAMDNTGLDDDLLALGLTPCVPPQIPMNNCDDQAGPFVIPDVIAIDTDDPAGFPNGRMLADPVMDLIFAVLLLDLGEHPIDLFTDLNGDGTPGPSLNPLANDVEFEADFPYLAPAH